MHGYDFAYSTLTSVHREVSEPLKSEKSDPIKRMGVDHILNCFITARFPRQRDWFNVFQCRV
jgi:hypothetical protein